VDDIPTTVGEGPQILGLAGLLPQVAVVAFVAFGIEVELAQVFALAYGSLILSFVGGIWWGLAMHRPRRQGRLGSIAVMPSVLAALLALESMTGILSIRWTLVVLGSALICTLLIDRYIVRLGEAPSGWMALRVPLSIGLGTLTILAGALR